MIRESKAPSDRLTELHLDPHHGHSESKDEIKLHGSDIGEWVSVWSAVQLLLALFLNQFEASQVMTLPEAFPSGNSGCSLGAIRVKSDY